MSMNSSPSGGSCGPRGSSLTRSSRQRRPNYSAESDEPGPLPFPSFDASRAMRPWAIQVAYLRTGSSPSAINHLGRSVQRRRSPGSDHYLFLGTALGFAPARRALPVGLAEERSVVPVVPGVCVPCDGDGGVVGEGWAF